MYYRLMGDTPYKKMTAADKEIVKEVGQFMKERGYSAYQAWKKENGDIEIRSREVYEGSNTIPGCIIKINIEKKNGYIIQQGVMDGMQIEVREAGREYKAGWPKKHRNREKKEERERE